MAEGFEPFHVPQQSRRDKLRVVLHNQNQNQNQNQNSCEEAEVTNLDGCGGLVPLYDHHPSLLPSNILTCANPLGGGGGGGNRNTDGSKQTQVCVSSVVKEEGIMNFMGYVSGFMNTASSNPYLDPQSSLTVNVNPTSIHDPFLYTAQNLRDFDQSFNGREVVTFKPCLNNESSLTTGQGLSLSLSSHHGHGYQQHNLPLEMLEGIVGNGASTSNDVRSSVPLGPFTGYASILKGSRFLKPAQQLLEELCDVGRRIYVDKCGGNSLPSMDNLSGTGIVDDSVSCSDHSENRRKKTRLISMLEEVYRRYKLYFQQMQAIVASFESVAGLGNAAPYASYALKTMSNHFRCLKNAITDQLRFTSKALGEGSFSKDDTPRFGTTDRWIHGERPIHNSGIHEPPVWRPQRGLPERAVAMLKAWLFENFLHPYPTDTDKQMLAKQTGLSRSQVSNWFINARVRLWKPMVEEIHALETRQKASEQTNSKPNEPLSTEGPLYSDKQPQNSLSQKVEDEHPFKRSRNEFPYIPDRTNEPMNFSHNNLSNHHNVGVSAAGRNSGVSLTLGLRQNNGVGMSESFPISISHRFGVEVGNDGYVINGFEARDIEGQLLHDFVG